MPIIYNGVTLTDIVYNGVALDKVVYNGVEVFTKAPAIIREPAVGEYYTNVYASYPWFRWQTEGNGVGSNGILIQWNSGDYDWVLLDSTTSKDATVISINGYTYYRGNYKESYYGSKFFGVYRVKN